MKNILNVHMVNTNTGYVYQDWVINVDGFYYKFGKPTESDIFNRCVEDGNIYVAKYLDEFGYIRTLYHGSPEMLMDEYHTRAYNRNRL